MRRLTALVVLLWAGMALAQNGPVTGLCDMGSTNAVTSGLSSSNTLMGITPSCLVTIYYTGTSTIVPSANIVTATGGPLGNPFTANSNGSWLFYASYAYGYDVVLSGGPVTITGLYPGFVYPNGGQSFSSVTITGAPTNTLVAADGSGYTTPVLPIAIASNKLTTAESVRNYGATGNGSTDDSAAIASACSAAPEILVPSGTYKIATNETFNCGMIFQGSASFSVPTGVTVTIQQPIAAPLQKIFSLAGTGVVYMTSTPTYPEWWGAKGDGSTDDTAALQAAITALKTTMIGTNFTSGGGWVQLSAKTYNTSSALAITSFNVGIRGVSQRDSVIMSSSASADILDVGGTSTVTSQYNRFSDFTVARSVAPTGTATGISLIYAGEAKFDRVDSWDSVRAFYQKDSAAIFYNLCGVEFFAGTSGNRYGWYMDGTDSAGFLGGPGFGSTQINNSYVSNSTTGTTSYGIYVTGTYIMDLFTDWFETNATTFGVYVNGTGTTGSFSDVHFSNSIITEYVTAGFYITGFNEATNHPTPQLSITGGSVITSATSSTGIYINGSSGVNVSGVQVLHLVNSGSGGTGVFITGANSKRNVVNGSVFNVMGGAAVSVYGAGAGNVVSGNSIYGEANNPSVAGIYVQSSTVNNVFSSNSVTGTTTGSVATGIYFDSTSSNNVFCGSNAIDPATVTIPISNAGTNNTCEPQVQHATIAGCNPGTALGSGYSCNTAGLTWPTAFPSANYIATCSVLTSGTGSVWAGLYGQTAAGLSIQLNSLVNTNTVSEVECMAEPIN